MLQYSGVGSSMFEPYNSVPVTAMKAQMSLFFFALASVTASLL